MRVCVCSICAQRLDTRVCVCVRYKGCTARTVDPREYIRIRVCIGPDTSARKVHDGF